MTDRVYLVMGRFARDGAPVIIKAHALQAHAEQHVERLTRPYDASDEYYSHGSSAEMVGLTSVWIEPLPVT